MKTNPKTIEDMIKEELLAPVVVPSPTISDITDQFLAGKMTFAEAVKALSLPQGKPVSA